MFCEYCKNEFKIDYELRVHSRICKNFDEETRDKILNLYLIQKLTLRQVSDFVSISKNKVSEF